MGDLKYRERLSSSVDKGLYRAIRKYSIETRIPLSNYWMKRSKIFLKKNGVSYEIEDNLRRKPVT